MHEDLICKSSGLFKAACSSQESNVGRPKTVSLSEVDKFDFHVYLDWTYAHDLTAVKAMVDEEMSEPTITDRWTRSRADFPAYDKIGHLCRLWAVGDCLQDNCFKNHVMDHILLHELPRRRILKMSAILTGLECTTPKSALRVWIVDHLAAFMSVRDLDVASILISAEVVFEVMRKVLTLRGKRVGEGAPEYKDRCKYHEHSEGTARCM